MKNLLLIVLFSIVMVSCGERKGEKGAQSKTAAQKVSTKANYKPDAKGTPYDLFLVLEQPYWEGELGDTLKAIIAQPVEMINQTEPMFDLLRINKKDYKNLVLRSFNHMIVDINSEKYKEPKMMVTQDVYAAPQTIVTLSGPDIESVTKYVSDNRDALIKTFMIAERDRVITQNTNFYEKNLTTLIQNRFGIDMKVPVGYKLRNDRPHFIWISYELRHTSLGIVIYDYPYTGSDDFSSEKLTAMRNKFVAQIPGPADGSYMITSEILPAVVKYQKINGRSWAVLRGFWDVKGDFMGGPFVSYSTLNLANNKIVTIDCYLYSPKESKRNYMRSLENVIYTVTVPSAPATETAKE